MTAATAKGRIEADVQLACVNPISRAIWAQADTHQDM